MGGEVLKLSDLAARPDFILGPLRISPSRRLVEGPHGKSTVEPLIMQVFLLLLDARGQVVTRTQLFDQLWGGVIVGDDSLNRAVAKVRKIAAAAAPGLFEIETVPRTGYRLVGDFEAESDAGAPRAKAKLPRRTVIAGGLAAAGAGGLGLWFVRSRNDEEFALLLRRGTQALEFNDPSADASQYFQSAVAMRPDDARAQGLLAYALAFRAEYAQPDQPGNAITKAEDATRRALALDPAEPYARLARIVMQRSLLDFAGTEDRLREVLKTDSNNIHIMRHLWNMLQCVGRSRDAHALVERALAIAPLSAGNHYPNAQLLWILGRTAEADRVIDNAIDYWPSHRFVRFARFTIFAFTGRALAAKAMLESPETRPQNYSPAGIALWRINLTALDQRTPSTINAAVKASVQASKQNLHLANQSVLALSGLGEIDAAFEIANALFAVQGATNALPRAGGQPVKGTAWRFAPWLFTPPTASLRADPRFVAICDAAGLTEYWARRGIKPDYQLGIS